MAPHIRNFSSVPKSFPLLFPDAMVDRAKKQIFGPLIRGFRHPTWSEHAQISRIRGLQLSGDAGWESTVVVSWSLGCEVCLFSHSSCYGRSLKINRKCTKIGKKKLLYAQFSSTTDCKSQRGHRRAGNPKVRGRDAEENMTSQKHGADAELHYQDYKGKSGHSCRKLVKTVGRDKLLCSSQGGVKDTVQSAELA